MIHNTLVLTLIAAFFISGCRGPNGSPGADGIKGDLGNTPVVLERPATEQECPTGGIVVTVNTVSTLLCNGSQGAPGVNLTPLVLMQLCPGNPSYPDIFIEYGICVGSKLYAVYSENGGFLTYLPPGAYVSNAVGSTCTFSVANGCQVSYP